MPTPSGSALTTRQKRSLQQFRRNLPACVSGFVLFSLMLIALLADPLLAFLGLDPFATNLFSLKQPPGPDHVLGTDEAGRDVLARLIKGSQASLTVGLITAVVAAAIGTGIGLIAGYFGGWLDGLLMRLTDGVIALPMLPLLIVLSALDFSKIGLAFMSEGSGLARIVLIISLVGWTTVARLVRAETLSQKERDYIRAARAQGASPWMIMRRHILPNVLSSIVVATTLSIGGIILIESVLSFLGLGISPPTPSWGNMLTNAEDYIWDTPELALWPGLAIFMTVIAFNFLGDGLQDALDPRHDG